MRTDATACGVGACAAIKVPVVDIAALRKAPSPLGGRTLAPSLLKHADHQTVVAVSVLLHAVHQAGWQDRSFAEWGLIAAPRFPGRITAAASMHKFKEQGVPGMSPLIIPTLSLHAMAASLSLAIKTQGFNYGVGGGHGHLAEALLSGLAAVEDDGVAGVWVVATQFSPEPVPDTAGQSLNACHGYGVALALEAVTTGRSGLHLRMNPTAAQVSSEVDRVVSGDEPSSGLVALAAFLDAMPPGLRSRRWQCPLPGGSALVIEDAPMNAGLALDGDQCRTALAG
jgi:hypothetical protein